MKWELLTKEELQEKYLWSLFGDIEFLCIIEKDKIFVVIKRNNKFEVGQEDENNQISPYRFR